MTLQPVHIEEFHGLNLVVDPEELGFTGAVDLLNVTFPPGRVRSRDGYATLTGSTPSGVVQSLGAFYTAGGARHIVYRDGTSAVAINDVGTQLAANAETNAIGDYIRFGTGTTESLYLLRGVSSALKWDGAVFSATAATFPSSFYGTVQKTDNRLVVGNLDNKRSRVQFSDAGDPETWPVNNWVDLHPNDGEKIGAVVAWREMVFAFKGSKFFVFYGNSTDPTGNPVFNYRPVEGVGLGNLGSSSPRMSMAVAGRDGVYFASDTGVYVTTGGPAQKVSEPLDPLFQGSPGVLTGLLGINHAISASITPSSIGIVNETLYVSVALGSGSTPSHVLVRDRYGNWSVFNIPVAAMVAFEKTAGVPELVFSLSTGSRHLMRHHPAASTDNGVAITSKYRSGLSDLGSPAAEKTVRETELVGTGSVSFGWGREFEDEVSSQSVSLGSSRPSRGLHRYAKAGELLGYQVDASNAWSLNRVVPMIREVRGVGERTS